MTTPLSPSSQSSQSGSEFNFLMNAAPSKKQTSHVYNESPRHVNYDGHHYKICSDINCELSYNSNGCKATPAKVGAVASAAVGVAAVNIAPVATGLAAVLGQSTLSATVLSAPIPIPGSTIVIVSITALGTITVYGISKAIQHFKNKKANDHIN